MNKNVDKIIWLTTFLIVSVGLLTLYSASLENLRVSQKVFYDQLMCAVVGFVLMFFLSRVNYRRFYDISYMFYAINILFLVLVLLAGKQALGAQRWFSIFGIRFQPSEIAKLSLILALGRYFSECREKMSFSAQRPLSVLWYQLVVPLVITAVPMLLIFKQPDLGTSLLFFGIYIFMLFTSRIPLRYFFGFLTLCTIAVPFTWQILKPYQKDRLLVFMNPNIDPLGAGYTIIQSKIAMGSGQLFGKGWLSGTQNQLNFLPECHTDFIFSVIGEEWGLMGTVFLLLCYIIFIYAGLSITDRLKDEFGSQVTVGLVGILTLQVVVNVGMVLGLCPVVGLTLPLVSYGRSSFMVSIIMVGILLSLSKKRIIF